MIYILEIKNSGKSKLWVKRSFKNVCEMFYHEVSHYFFNIIKKKLNFNKYFDDSKYAKECIKKSLSLYCAYYEIFSNIKELNEFYFKNLDNFPRIYNGDKIKKLIEKSLKRNR